MKTLNLHCLSKMSSSLSLCFLYHNRDRKSTRLNSSHLGISYAVFCLKKKKLERVADKTVRQGGVVYHSSRQLVSSHQSALSESSVIVIRRRVRGCREIGLHFHEAPD